LDLKTSDSIKIIDPVGYLEMIYLLENCMLVMTDSGGLQKEAFFFKKPCITMRDETEWVELVEHGFNSLTGAETPKIIHVYRKVTQANYDFQVQLYGDGKTGERIVKILA
jgi:UDP-GlcNAc3NAcA epimerase